MKQQEMIAKQARTWQCLVCGYVHEGDGPPDVCPVCGVGPDQFAEITQTDTGFISDKAERFLIVGNGAAGTTAAKKSESGTKTAP
jgi:rubredoxin